MARMDNGTPTAVHTELAAKIARLVEERGWNQEDFARISGLNRQTVRQILQPTGKRRLRNATVMACARALGLTVNDLRTQSLERLLPRMHGDQKPELADRTLRQLYERASQPELLAWLERNPERARHLTPDEIDELLSLQGPDSPMSRYGVEHIINLIERKRRIIEQVHAIAGTEYLDTLEKVVGLMYDKVQPYRDRA